VRLIFTRHTGILNTDLKFFRETIIITISKGYRNTRKFQLKYGFDPHLFADGWALGLNDEELAQLLGIQRSSLEIFRSNQVRMKYSISKWYTIYH
jgi:hypothetical protein